MSIDKIMGLFNDFKEALGQNQSPKGSALLLQASWWEAKGNRDQACRFAQDDSNRDAVWVYACLHRKEGDDWNADHWYMRIGKSGCDDSLDQEWEEIAPFVFANIK